MELDYKNAHAVNINLNFSRLKLITGTCKIYAKYIYVRKVTKRNNERS